MRKFYIGGGIEGELKTNNIEKIHKSISEEDYQRLDKYIEDIYNIVDIDKIMSAINYEFNRLNPEEEKSIFNFVEFIETGKEWYKIGLKAIEHTNKIYVLF